MYNSKGPLRYSIDRSGYKLHLMVDTGIADYYRSLIPPWIYLNRQMFPAHVSIVRKEIPVNMDLWGKYEGEIVEFTYSNVIQHGTVYYWLNIFSKRLEEIRVELGLSIEERYTQPPEGFLKTFHCTLGNVKS